jgi:hypothetical protein
MPLVCWKEQLLESSLLITQLLCFASSRKVTKVTQQHHIVAYDRLCNNTHQLQIIHSTTVMSTVFLTLLRILAYSPHAPAHFDHCLNRMDALARGGPRLRIHGAPNRPRVAAIQTSPPTAEHHRMASGIHGKIRHSLERHPR